MLSAAPWVTGVERALTASTYDADGALSNAIDVTVTVTLPDGTTSTPSVTNTGTGMYEALFTPTLVGTHTVLWTIDGLDADSSFGPDSFHVEDSTLPGAVGLVEAKEHLNIPDTDHDADGELLGFILAATRALEQRVGPLTRRTVTDTYNGGSPAVVLTAPVVGVTSVSESGTAVDSSGYSVSPASGVLTRVSGYSRSTWTSGFDNIAVTYTVGRTAVPADLRQAVLELVRHLWDTQRGTMRGRRNGDDFVTGQGYTLPNRVLELIAPYELPGIA